MIPSGECDEERRTDKKADQALEDTQMASFQPKRDGQDDGQQAETGGGKCQKESDCRCVTEEAQELAIDPARISFYAA